MLLEPSVLSDAKFWISIIALFASGWSAYNSWRSRQMARKALSISEEQERRRKPKLTIYTDNNFRRSLPGQQCFAIRIAISNPTDINNSIVRAELKISCVLAKEQLVSYRTPHMPELPRAASKNSPADLKANALVLPTGIDAHQAVSGWLFFTLDSAVIAGKTVDSYRLILEDSHGDITQAKIGLIRNENEVG